MIAIIPARGGSTRIPRKNIREFHGKPIIQYSIETAQKSNLFDTIIVSTDDIEIAAFSQWMGVCVHQRPDYLGENHVGTQEVAREALIKLSEIIEIDYACVIYPTSPLLSVEELKGGFDLLDAYPDANYVYSIYPDGKDAGCFYWGKVQSFIDRDPLHENSVPDVKALTYPLENACDINTPEDWSKALVMYSKLKEQHGH